MVFSSIGVCVYFQCANWSLHVVIVWVNRIRIGAMWKMQNEIYAPRTAHWIIHFWRCIEGKNPENPVFIPFDAMYVLRITYILSRTHIHTHKCREREIHIHNRNRLKWNWCLCQIDIELTRDVTQNYLQYQLHDDCTSSRVLLCERCEKKSETFLQLHLCSVYIHA